MLQYEVAKKLYKEIQDKAEKVFGKGIDERYQDFIFSTLVYANTLTVWSQMGMDEKLSYQEKKEEHLEYAMALHKVCLELGIDELDDILIDEETHSDFACCVQLFVSLTHRSNGDLFIAI